jgi:hypothetical protein
MASSVVVTAARGPSKKSGVPVDPAHLICFGTRDRLNESATATTDFLKLLLGAAGADLTGF